MKHKHLVIQRTWDSAHLQHMATHVKVINTKMCTCD